MMFLGIIKSDVQNITKFGSKFGPPELKFILQSIWLKITIQYKHNNLPLGELTISKVGYLAMGPAPFHGGVLSGHVPAVSLPPQSSLSPN